MKIKSRKKVISICIPVYNEERNLPVAVKMIEQTFKELKRYNLEIIITDNGSTDGTWALVKSILSKRPQYKAYRFSRNFGYQNSIFAGLSRSTGDAVIEIDADLEDPPHVIPEFIQGWEEGYDVVYGVRRTRHAPPHIKLMFKLFYRLLNRLSDLEIPENSGDFRLIDRKVVNVLKMIPERNLYLRGLVTYLGFKQKAVYYDRNPRLSGTSKFRMLHYIILAIDALTAFSKAPLRLIGVCGILLFIVSVGASFSYLLSHFLHGSGTKGFTTIVIMILSLHSITFIFLGIIGEYLSRIFDDAKNRPRIIIAESLNDKNTNNVL